MWANYKNIWEQPVSTHKYNIKVYIKYASKQHLQGFITAGIIVIYTFIHLFMYGKLYGTIGINGLTALAEQ